MHLLEAGHLHDTTVRDGRRRHALGADCHTERLVALEEAAGIAVIDIGGPGPLLIADTAYSLWHVGPGLQKTEAKAHEFTRELKPTMWNQYASPGQYPLHLIYTGARRMPRGRTEVEEE